MNGVTEIKKRYLEEFERFEKRWAGNGQSWLQPIRQEAFARFDELGFPTKKDEDWKFTSVAPIATTPFSLTRPGNAGTTLRNLESATFLNLESSRLVFVNGRYFPDLSSLQPLPEGVKVTSLAKPHRRESEWMEPHLAQYADYNREAFTALNTAFIEDGGAVYAPSGTVLEAPIHLLYVSTATATPTMTHPRNLIVAGDNCQFTVVEEYISMGGEVYLSNTVTEVVAGKNTVISHFLVERESTEAFTVSTLRIHQERSSNVTSHTLLLGGALVRNNIHPVLAGEGGDCTINGLFMPTGDQHMDNFMMVEHASPHCDSRQFYNGILGDRAHGVFSGRIIVHKDAQKTDAKQTNRNLLLSERAQIDSRPQLEIYADDVKCTHGATIGRLDNDAVFYLRSRGISEESARALLLFAFAAESLDRIGQDSIRHYLEGLVRKRLPQGTVLEEAR